jgi:hypothetical protein
MKLKSLLLAAALLCGLSTTVHAQATISPPQFTLGGTNIDLTVDTNWAAIPFGIYRTDTHQWGYGGAVLYQVTPNFWTGVRADNISGLSTTAGVQAQLQATVSVDGIDLTPFADTSVGMGTSSLYASAGAGALVNFHTWSFKIGSAALSVSAGAVASYEHVVDGNANFNQVVGGPLIQVSF